MESPFEEVTDILDTICENAEAFWHPKQRQEEKSFYCPNCEEIIMTTFSEFMPGCLIECKKCGYKTLVD